MKKDNWIELGEHQVKLNGLRAFKAGWHQYPHEDWDVPQIVLRYLEQTSIYLDFETEAERDEALAKLKAALKIGEDVSCETNVAVRV